MDRELNEDELLELYSWIDKIPLSRPKKQISRDFSDGVMAAEVVKYFFPKLVDLHNYIPAHSTQQKVSNWAVLNRKVLSKLDFTVPEVTVRRIVLSTAGAVVPVLSTLRQKIERKLEHNNNDHNNADHNTDEALELENCDSKNHEKSMSDIDQRETIILTQLEEMKTNERKRQKMSEPQQTLKVLSDTDPAFKEILQEKEETVKTLQETVEILQMKVDKLENLVHLKDLRIENLTQHLEAYKARGNAC